MILAYDGSSLAQGLSGVGYYTRRLLDELASRALLGRLASARRALEQTRHRASGRAPARGTPLPGARGVDGGVRPAGPARARRRRRTLHELHGTALARPAVRGHDPRHEPGAPARVLDLEDAAHRAARAAPGGAAGAPRAGPLDRDARRRRAPARRSIPAASASSPTQRRARSWRRPTLRRPAGPPYFLFVGNLEPRKNLARALRAFARIAPSLPGHRFLIAGQPGWKYDDVLRELRRPELAGRVEWRGYVAEDELPALYRHATAFVYPSLYEGFGLPVIEAMACGTPVLTSRVSALPELAEGAAAAGRPQGRGRAGGGAARARHGRGACASACARPGRARAAQYSWEATADRTIEAYEEARRG